MDYPKEWKLEWKGLYSPWIVKGRNIYTGKWEVYVTLGCIQAVNDWMQSRNLGSMN